VSWASVASRRGTVFYRQLPPFSEDNLKTIIYPLGNKEKTKDYITELSSELSDREIPSLKGNSIKSDQENDLIQAGEKLSPYPVYIDNDSITAKQVMDSYVKHKDTCGLVIVINDGKEPTEEVLEVSYQIGKISDTMMFAI